MWYHEMFGEINLSLCKDNKPRTVRKLAKYNNQLAWRMWFNILVERALHRYKHEGLPETMNERVIKLSLLWHGSVTAFQHMGQHMALPGASGASGVTVYGDYTHSWVYGRNGWNKEIPLWIKGEKDLPMLAEAYTNIPPGQQPCGVWFRETETRRPFIDVCIQFADAIADTWRKLSNARKLTSKGFVVVGEEAEAATALRLFQDLEDNVPFIYITHKLEEAQKDIIPLQHNAELIKSYTDHIIWLLSMFDRLCGKNTMDNPDKMSGMAPDEIYAGLETVYGTVDAMCAYMNEYGWDVYNQHAGTNIKVVPEGRLDENAQDAVQGMDQDPGSGEMEQDRPD